MTQTNSLSGFFVVVIPLDSLKQGLKKLQDQTHGCKAMLEVTLRAKQVISEADEEWLDNAGNLVDKERVVDELDKAMDFADAFERLDSWDKAIVQKLTELADKQGAAPAKMRKCMQFSFKYLIFILRSMQVPHRQCSLGLQANLTNKNVHNQSRRRMPHSNKELKF